MKGEYNENLKTILINEKEEIIEYNNIDTTFGQSGSPIFIYNKYNNNINNIIGIHRGTHNNCNFAILFTYEKLQWINNFIVPLSVCQFILLCFNNSIKKKQQTI